MTTVLNSFNIKSQSTVKADYSLINLVKVTDISVEKKHNWRPPEVTGFLVVKGLIQIFFQSAVLIRLLKLLVSRQN